MRAFRGGGGSNIPELYRDARVHAHAGTHSNDPREPPGSKCCSLGWQQHGMLQLNLSAQRRALNAVQ